MSPCEKHDEFENKLGEVHTAVIEIKDALIGTLNSKGLVTKLYDLEKEVTTLRILRDKINGIVWKIAAGSLGGGGLTGAIIYLAAKHFSTGSGNQ